VRRARLWRITSVHQTDNQSLMQIKQFILYNELIDIHQHGTVFASVIPTGAKACQIIRIPADAMRKKASFHVATRWMDAFFLRWNGSW
jgi:hypothetical protein